MIEVTRFEWDGKLVSNQVREASERAIERAAQHVLQVANNPSNVPVDEGTLRASGGYSLGTEGATAVAAVYYDTEYARRQHEETSWNHPGGGRAKWLEAVIAEEAATVHDLVAARMKAIFG